MEIKNVTTDPNEAVDNGIAFFGNNYANWREKQIDDFNVNSEDACPLSLVTGMNFEDALHKLGKDWNWARNHGFFPHIPYFTCSDLQEIWERKLRD